MVRRTVAAVLVFLVAVSVGVFLAGRDPAGSAEAADTLPPTTTTVVPQAVFVAERETVIGPAVIVADAPFIDGSQLVVTFSLTNLAPTADLADVMQPQGFGNFLAIPPEALNTVFIDDWRLVADGNEFSGTVANPAARAARFEVGADFDLATIDGVTIASYAVLAPVSSQIALAAGQESAPVAPGVTARLLAVTEQDNTIVQVELVSDRGFNLDNLRVTGSGPGWLAAVREAEGRPRWNLTFDAATSPSPIEMTVEGSVWVEVEAAVDVVLGDPE